MGKSMDIKVSEVIMSAIEMRKPVITRNNNAKVDFKLSFAHFLLRVNSFCLT